MEGDDSALQISDVRTITDGRKLWGVTEKIRSWMKVDRVTG